LPNQEFQDAARAHTSLLHSLEKKCLIWLAERMPRWVSSDQLTALGLFAMLMTGISYWLSRWNRYVLLMAVFWLAVNWFGDSLDGTLARVRNRQRPRYGFYVDHVVDAFGTFFLLSGFALSGYMDRFVAMGVLIAYFMLNIEVYLATYTLGRFRLSFWKVSPTELRILISIGSVALLFRPWVTLGGTSYRLYDVGGVVAIAGIAITLLRSVVRNTLELYREERLP
jgi:phosphatidylglycerophosphate synthase